MRDLLLVLRVMWKMAYPLLVVGTTGVVVAMVYVAYKRITKQGSLPSKDLDRRWVQLHTIEMWQWQDRKSTRS